MTRTETRYGCFLSDLTGLARSPSIANPPAPYISVKPGGGKRAMGFVLADAGIERSCLFAEFAN